MAKITQEEIIDLMLNRELNIQDVINAIVDFNGIVGVGLITLAETFYILTVKNKELRKPNITEVEVEQIINEMRIKMQKSKLN